MILAEQVLDDLDLAARPVKRPRNRHGRPGEAN